MQGCGVSTPCAALVAAATCGFLRLMHIPNDGTLAIGAKSLMLAAGWFPAWTRCTGVTIMDVVPGGTAIGHCSVAPLTTRNGIAGASQPPVAWISTRRFSPAFGSSVFSSWLSPLPTAFKREDATPFSVR